MELELQDVFGGLLDWVWGLLCGDVAADVDGPAGPVEAAEAGSGREDPGSLESKGSEFLTSSHTFHESGSVLLLCL